MIIRNLMQRASYPLSGLNNPANSLYQTLVGNLPQVESGVTVNTTTAMRVMAVFACVRLISETSASLPIKVYKRGDESRAELRLPSDAYLWDEPNPDMTKQYFWECLIAAALLDGNAYINTVRNAVGRIVEIWPVSPSRVVVKHTKSGEKIYEVDGTKYTARDIVHVPAFGTDGVYGLSPIGQARQSIGLSLAAEEYGARMFGNGSVPGGVLQTDAPLTDDQAAALKARWNEYHRGLKQAGSVAVLGNGAQYHPLGIVPEDAQFIETRRFQVSEIARLYRVPPHMIADMEKSTSWGTGIEQQNIAFVQYTLRPWITRFEQAATKWLLPVSDRYARFSLDALLRGDTAARIAYYSAGRRDGWLSQNDIRQHEDMPPILDGDDYLEIPTGAAPAQGGPNADTEE